MKEPKFSKGDVVINLAGDRGLVVVAGQFRPYRSGGTYFYGVQYEQFAGTFSTSEEYLSSDLSGLPPGQPPR